MAQYYPEIFNAADLKRAREVILTNEGPGADTDTRWAIETPYVLSLIRASLPLKPESVVLDYGCGVGRIAKAMIDAFGCSVIGVDISADMRRLAADYVGSSRFQSVSPEEFDRLVGQGFRVDAAISIWVLQHCFAPDVEIARIRRSLKERAGFFVLHMPKRAIPATRDLDDNKRQFFWGIDAVDVAALLREAFALEAEGIPEQEGLPNMANAGAYWMRLRNLR